MPASTILTVALHGNKPLQDPIPRIWQNTADTSWAPFIAGIAKTNTGWQAYTITLRGMGNAGTWTHGSGPFVIHANAPLKLVKRRITRIASLIARLKSHEAVATLDGSAIDPSFNGTISGTIDGNIWTTDATIPKGSSKKLPKGDLAIDFVSLPGSWPFIQNALKDQGINLIQMPKMLGWSPSTGTLPTLTLDFGISAPSTSTILSLAAAAGRFDTSRLFLPDGTIAEDLRLPLHLLTSTSSMTWTAETGTIVHVGPHAASIDTSTTFPNSPPLEDCPGKGIARLSMRALQTIANHLGDPLNGLASLELIRKNGILEICWK